ncbi:hypothetical protein [Oceanirhabdus seepicola]|uniref:Uncharacterized protein n=1 Tax=Oceanirhabdus seepicola TaxID=2828781 RepID=A0A9J6PA36_9CLOT|nr:hypothetical protein [Oceanirhabdus seepicola]MCM1992625.1 hypothetical protein [Oceanirhabdus seepicola]
MTNKRNFAWPVTIMPYEDYIALKECVEKHRDLLINKEIIIFGAGIRGSLFCKLMEKFGYNQLLFCDNNPDKCGGYINQYEIHSPELIEEKRDNAIVLISVENGYSIEKQLEKSGYIKNKTYFFVESLIYPSYIEEFFRIDPIEILFLGDCGLSQISINDTNHNNLGHMIKNSFGEKRAKVLAMHGMGIRSYYNILKGQLHLGIIPKVVGLMVNFEVFTGKHHLLPRTQHVNLFGKILDDLQNPEFELVEYHQLIEERFNNFKLDVSSNYQGDHLENNRRMVLRMNYMYNIKKNTEDMEYLIKILELCKDKGIRVLPFIPPVNYEYAFECIGEKFKVAYDTNCEKMKAWVREQGDELLDLSYILGSEYFADPKTIDETANAKGRQMILEEFLKALK